MRFRKGFVRGWPGPAHAWPGQAAEEEQYGESNIAAALSFIEAKFGKLGKTLPVAFDRLKIPVRDGGA